MPEGKVKNVFPGGNTSLGFFSYYNYIIDPDEASRIFVIKGGPGVGKSTFMKKIGNEMLKRGYDIEFMHCSSDNNSLDGVVIPALKYAFIDGTAPHIVDPKFPGAVDEIINFGEYWNEEGIKQHREDVINDSREATRYFNRAYKYLKAAASIYEDSAYINSMALNKGKLDIRIDSIINAIFNDRYTASIPGKERCLFASAMTPNGYCNFLDSILTTKYVYELRGGLATGEEKILEEVRNSAVKRGLLTESYYCAFRPNKLEHLVIPELDVSFTTSNPYHSSRVKSCETIDIKSYLDKEILDRYGDELYQNQEEFDNLLSIALLNINKAKTVHDRLETYYVPNINFKGIDECYEKVLKRILI